MYQHCGAYPGCRSPVGVILTDGGATSPYPMGHCKLLHSTRVAVIHILAPPAGHVEVGRILKAPPNPRLLIRITRDRPLEPRAKRLPKIGLIDLYLAIKTGNRNVYVVPNRTRSRRLIGLTVTLHFLPADKCLSRRRSVKHDFSICPFGEQIDIISDTHSGRSNVRDH